MSFCKRNLLTFISGFFLLLATLPVKAQNTSNQGTDFWVAYTGHVDNFNSRLTLFITSKVDASVSITAGGVLLPTVVVQANKAVPVYINPNIYTNTYVGLSDGVALNSGIHVTATSPIVLYSHISRSARSAATMVLPTKALGNDYYAMAYNQMPSGGGEYRVSQVTLIGVEDETLIEITPSVSGVGAPAKAANVPYQITLNKGDVYQFQSTTDVTGTRIRTVENCKPLAVFSGSTKVGFCEEPGSIVGVGQDNLYQQLFPVSSWGKNYITAPFYNALHGVKDIIRVLVSKDNTTVTVNGSTSNANGTPLTNPYAKGSVITFTTSSANTINASEPISVAQIQVSQSCNPNNIDQNNPVYPGDPEMTILNPIEQKLTDITVYSAISVPSAPTSITKHYLNVILKTADIPTFTIDNSTIPAANFTVIDSEYSYLIQDVTSASASDPTHRIKAENGFLAIAYGYGTYESYAYLAGSDIKNLNQFVKLKNPTTNQEAESGCTAQDFDVEVTLPYQTTELRWDFGNGQAEVIQTNPVADRQIVLNGQNLYVFKFQSTVNYTTAGVKNLMIKSLNPGASLCGDYDQINLSFEILDLPIPEFSVSNQTCVNTSLSFIDQSTFAPKFVVKWIWDFGDGTLVENESGVTVNHTYTQAGDYQPVLTVFTSNGCSVSSPPLSVHVSPLPISQFVYSSLTCEQTAVNFTDQSATAEGVLVKWNWDFGDGQTSQDKNPSHIFTAPGNYSVSLVVETNEGCLSEKVSQNLTIYALPQVDFLVPDICLNDAQAGFTNLSTNADGSSDGLSYVWNFGDAYATLANPNSSTATNPEHSYTREGDYLVTLWVTTAEGCVQSLTKNFRVNGVNPVANFEIISASDLCSSIPVLFKNKSLVAGFGEVTRLEWYYDYINQPEAVEVDEEPSVDKIYTHLYPKFHTPATKNYTVRLVAYSGISCISEAFVQVLTLKPVPEVEFDELPAVCLEISPFQITQAKEKYGFTGTYKYSGPGLSSTGLFSPKLAGPGTHTLKYVFNAQNACADSLSRNITVYETPSLNAGRDTTILEGGSTPLNATASGSALIYSWYPATGLSASNIPNPVASPIIDTKYTLTVQSDQGCVVADEVFIRVLQLPEVPNAFTPNGDGKNEVWNIKYLGSYERPTVEVFNRYGQRVFYSLGYQTPWDGRFNGEELPIATYYYIINPGNGRKPIVGSLTIIR